MVTVLFFGPVADRVGVGRLDVEFHAGMCLQDVFSGLQPQYPEAFVLVSLAAVNGAHATDMSLTLTDNCEVVFMSKFSGG